jgi:hypothetical protein
MTYFVHRPENRVEGRLISPVISQWKSYAGRTYYKRRSDGERGGAAEGGPLQRPVAFNPT